ncbi:type III pantothenate kinase [Chitinasiproducens palmae]|uniref:Type III pantothenate kinase n=1 Tax=Chitinasiproducens palmae TaxID=1770053 RepID=A0A1H2PNS8_9BURK|nr:type III pantothenate kinase [Chitinasiproducens palmae]SDV48367.1 type III pantothenate kinase [Chitinasiproducens palmae]
MNAREASPRSPHSPQSGFPALLIDAGNSRIKWLLAAADGTRLAAGHLSHACAPAETAAFDALPPPATAWLSNVAGDAVGARLQAVIAARWLAVPVQRVRACAQQGGVRNGYREPGRLGSDRWASLLGARAAFPGETLLIATFGTATTLELLEADGRFTGGLIAPGWSLMLRSLGEHTAQLPALTPAAAEALGADPSQAFANETARAMVEGCRAAQAGLIERAWRARREADPATTLRCVLAGGAADEIAPVLTIPHTRHDDLVLAGLYEIAREAIGASPD